MAISKTATTFTDTAATAQKTFTARGIALGNIVVVESFVATTSTSNKVTAIAGTGFTWTELGAGYASTITGGANFSQIWMGVCTSVQGTAQTQTATVSNSGLYSGFWPIGEFTNDNAATTWALDVSGTRAAATAASISYPALTAAVAGELYVGAGSTGSGGAGGTTGSGPAGMVFTNSSTSQAGCYGILPAAGSTGAITQTKSASSITSAYSVLVRATTPRKPGLLLPF